MREMKPIRRLSIAVKHRLWITALTGSFAALFVAPSFAAEAAIASRYSALLAGNSQNRFDALPVAIDPMLDAVVQWDRLRRDGYTAALPEFTAFLRQHQGWPAAATIRRRAERSMTAATPASERLAYFAANAPLSALGKLRLAQAYAASGRMPEAIVTARDAWDSSGLDAASEAELLERFAPMLSPNDHLLRFERQLWAGQTSAALRVLSRLSPGALPLAKARLALQQGSPNADALVAGLNEAERNDPGLIIDQVARLKRSNDLDKAAQVMAEARIPPGSVLDAEAWLKLRLELGRAALRSNDNERAYQLFSGHRAFSPGKGLNEHSLADRQAFIDAEWLAGWTALRRLDRASLSVLHFQNVRAAALTPVSQARGDYWAGRGAEAAGRTAEAERFYAAAASHPDYFYGQLASERLGRPLALRGPAASPIGAAARANFEANSLVRATRLLGEIGARNLQTLFMRALVEQGDNNDAARLIAELAGPLGRPDLGVLMGKAARGGGELSLIEAAFPTLSLPAELTPDWTVIHAVARQESQFDRAATSGANARGLMQLLPGTAQETAVKLGLPFNINRLIDDPIYNVTLGAAYYQRVRKAFGGSHVLAAAAYNAGPGNVRKFIKLNGSPNDAEVDVLDWIERIPLSETRTYVQRVIENAMVYDLLYPGNASMPTTNRLSAYLGKRTPG